jgi:hypothetical protein
MDIVSSERSVGKGHGGRLPDKDSDHNPEGAKLV